jgi:hypothetical protein
MCSLAGLLAAVTRHHAYRGLLLRLHVCLRGPNVLQQHPAFLDLGAVAIMTRIVDFCYGCMFGRSWLVPCTSIPGNKPVHLFYIYGCNG